MKSQNMRGNLERVLLLLVNMKFRNLTINTVVCESFLSEMRIPQGTRSNTCPSAFQLRFSKRISIMSQNDGAIC